MRTKLFRQTIRVLKSFSGRRRKVVRHKNLLQREGRMLGAVKKTAWGLQFHRPKMLRFLALGSSILGKKCAFFGGA